MRKNIRILYIEDNPADIRLVKEMLSESPGEFELEAVNRLFEGMERLSAEEYDIVLLDLGLPDSNGLKTFNKVHSISSNIPFIILSGLSDENVAIQGVRDGAQSYLIKDKIDSYSLINAIRHSIERCKLIEELKRTATNLKERIKELNCLHEVSKIVEKEDADVEKLVPRIIDLIPPAFLNPENTVSRIVIGDKEFRSPNFKETKSVLSEPIFLLGEQIGRIEIHLLEDKTRKGTEPFIEEEQNLLKTISEYIGRIVERRKTEDELKKSEERHRRLFETMAQGVVYKDRDGKVISANPSAEKITGFTLDQILGKTSRNQGMKAIQEDGSDFPREKFPAMIALKTGKEVKNQIMGIYNPVDEAYRWIDISAVPIYKPGEKEPHQAYTTFSDITQILQSRNHINHLNRLLSSIRNINQLIVKEKNKEKLLEKVCEILVEVTGYFFVWIGFINEENKKVTPIAKWGFENGYLDNITITWDEDITAKGPVGKAIKTKKACVFNDLMNNPDFTPWKKEAEDRGYRSSIAVPIIYHDIIYGTLNVYADIVNYFYSDEIELLEEAAQDIAYALFSIDIEKKQEETQENLRKSEEKYRTIIESIDDGYFEVDIRGNFVFFNESMCNILGYSRDEMLGLSYREYMDKEASKEVYNIFNEVFRTKKVTKVLDREIIKKNRERVYASTSISPILDKEGRVTGFRGVARDITEKKRMEDELRKSEENYRSLVENIDSVIFNIDVAGNFSYVSPRIKNILKYDIEDLMGKPFHSLIHPDDLPLLLENREKVLNGTIDSSSLVFRVFDKDGNIVFVHSAGRPIIKDGEIVGVTAIINDITEKKKMDDALKKSEENYRSLVENINDVIYNVDSEGNFTFVSPRIADISKYNPEDLLGSPFISLVHPDDLPILLESLEKTQQGVVDPLEYRVVDKEGNIIFIRSSSRLIKKNGEVMGMTGVITDVTEKKKMEGQLIQAEKLSSLGGILSGVAHELNNPLTSIIGNAQILMRRDIPSDIKDKLEVIMKESIRSSKIVGGLLAFAREHKSEKKMIDINEIIFEAYRLREYELRVNDITMNLNLSDNIPQTSADPYQLQQVFINLINNAHDALVEKNGGILDIFTFHKGDKIVIEFKDDGIGIPKDCLKKIFDPFFTTKEVGKGTGLGMSIVYGIITDHDGTIDVESEMGQGARFIIHLPITKEFAEEEEEEHIKTVKKPEGKIKVLVVEDEESLRDFLVEALEGDGYIAEMARSGEEAIELIEKGDYDIIITDMKMPGLTGQNIYNYVKKRNQLLAERMVFITGDILGEETQKFFRLTGAKFVEKPFQLDELFSILVDLLTERKNLH